MTRFCITGKIGPREIIQHVIKAETQAEAWVRFGRAYAGRECVLIKVKRVGAR